MVIQAGRQLTMNAVEEALIGVHELWWRSPGDGAWPYAGDGPWHLIRAEQGDIVGEASTTVLDTGRKLIDVLKVETARRPRTPLDMEEVAERDRVTAWLAHAGEDAKLLWLATGDYWRGEPAPGWTRIGKAMGVTLTRQALAWRYRKGLAAICCALNGWGAVAQRRLASEYQPSCRPIAE